MKQATIYANLLRVGFLVCLATAFMWAMLPILLHAQTAQAADTKRPSLTTEEREQFLRLRSAYWMQRALAEEARSQFEAVLNADVKKLGCNFDDNFNCVKEVPK